MSTAFNIPADIDAIILSVPHNGRASDDMTYLRDLVGAGMRAAHTLSDDDMQWEISAASKNPAWLDIEYGRRIEALLRAAPPVDAVPGEQSQLAKDFPPMGGLTECDMGDSYE